MDKLEMTPEQQLAFDGFIDINANIKSIIVNGMGTTGIREVFGKRLLFEVMEK